MAQLHEVAIQRSCCVHVHLECKSYQTWRLKQEAFYGRLVLLEEEKSALQQRCPAMEIPLPAMKAVPEALVDKRPPCTNCIVYIEVRGVAWEAGLAGPLTASLYGNVIFTPCCHALLTQLSATCRSPQHAFLRACLPAAYAPPAAADQAGAVCTRKRRGQGCKDKRLILGAAPRCVSRREWLAPGTHLAGLRAARQPGTGTGISRD